MPPNAHTNRLAQETSPYLLQHAHNPVDWYPWSPEAFEKARAEDKPLLLSVGYSACHWCHVMERESFEDETTATLMNERFVSVKVDREERPDVDAIYMEAVTSATGHGGWPMTVFLLPDGSPMAEEVQRSGQGPGLMFYGGTYFPNQPRHGMPSFKQVLLAAAEAYAKRREDVLRGSERFRSGLGERVILAPRSADALDERVLVQAERTFASSFDATWGGFGRAPKFPQPMGLEALLRAWLRSRNAHSLKMVTHTLDKMAQGGMYDHLGGGFARYSVDERWLVPHFEKMLYDNAQLARCYLLAHLATGSAHYRRVCEEVLDYVVRDMTSPEGGFYSAEDADSEGEEGKFYVWTPDEVGALLGEEDSRVFNAWFDVTAGGNFEGKTILNTPRYADVVSHTLGISEARLHEVIERGRRLLFKAREQRARPGRDDKVLTAWNGLMLRAFAEAASAFDRDDYRQVAIKNADFVLSTLRTTGGRLLRSHKDGQAKFNAYLEDYAFFAAGLLSLYEATFEVRYFQAARSLIDVAIEQFADEEGGGFFDTSADHEALVTRPKDLYDNATPSGNSVAVETLLRLAELTGEASYRDRAERVLGSLAGAMGQHPTAFGHLLCAYDFALGPVKEIALVGDPSSPDTQALVRTVFTRFLPNKVVALRDPNNPAAEQTIPLLRDRPMLPGEREGQSELASPPRGFGGAAPAGRHEVAQESARGSGGAQRPLAATAYVCESFSCRLPVTTPDELAAQLQTR